jgi:uncharacterized protein (TIGR02145 family)
LNTAIKFRDWFGEFSKIVYLFLIHFFMKAAIQTSLVAILLLAISCKKESIPAGNNYSSTSIRTDVTTRKYTSVYIHGQRWMSTNLAVSRYRNGDEIPYVRDKHQWDTLTTGAWCWYRNDSINGAIYGKLYNWYAVHDPRGLAPTGWHIPSIAEWDTLAAHLGNRPGDKLKDTGTIEAGTGLWHTPNSGATNKHGFTGLPAGTRAPNGKFEDIGYDAFFWTSTEHDEEWAWSRYLTNIYTGITPVAEDKQCGFSVRCIRD